MTSALLLDEMRGKLGPALRAVDEPVPDTLYLTVDRSAVRPACQYLQDALGARFIVSAGVDRRLREGCLSITHIFSRDKEKQFICVRADVPENAAEIEAISPGIPAATWSER